MSATFKESVGGLIWYCECKKLALDQIRAFVPPANSHNMRMYYSLSLTNLLALIDLSEEVFGGHISTDWENTLEGIGGHTGKNNAAYVRELRNAAIHRGLDITSSGTVLAGHVYAVAPVEIQDRWARKPPYNTFAPLLINLFEICDQRVSSIIFSSAETELTASEEIDVERERIIYLEEVDRSIHMPEWVKKSAREMVNEIPFQILYANQIEKLRSLLRPS